MHVNHKAAQLAKYVKGVTPPSPSRQNPLQLLYSRCKKSAPLREKSRIELTLKRLQGLADLRGG